MLRRHGFMIALFVTLTIGAAWPFVQSPAWALQALSSNPGSGTGGTYPAGGPPQIGGYSATNTPEAETVSGGANSCTFSRTGANAYSLACPNATTATSGDSSTLIATTQFVQYALAALNPLASVELATIAVLPNTPTYSNGTAGVGATLTRTGNGTLTVDGTVANLNDRVLVKNQASTFQNGVYTVTAAGDGSNPWVLTRSTDYNTAANIDSVGAVPVAAGGTLAGTLWLEQLSVTTIGTDPLTYIQIFTAQGGGGGGGNQLSGDVNGKANKNTVNNLSNVTNASLAKSGLAFSTQPWEFQVPVGSPTASQKWYGVCAQTITFPANFATTPFNSQFICPGTNPSETDVYTFKVNGSTIGQVSVTTGCVPTFTTSGGTSKTCTAGQPIEIDAPATVSGTGLVLDLAGTRPL